MEALGGAASVIAVIDMTAKVTNLCYQYSNAVAGARADIERLLREAHGLDTTLQHAKRLFESPTGKLKLSASRELFDGLERCEGELDKLRHELEPGTTRKAMRKFGVRALKWPFSSTETEAIVATIERYQRRIDCALQIDQTNILLDINEGVQKLSVHSDQDVSVARKPHFIVPFPRDPDFVDRPAIQMWMNDQYEGSHSRLAVVGLGGLGKSQVAIEFAYILKSKFPSTSVIWVYGSTKERIEESYRSIANTFMLPGRHDPGVNVLALVRDWLQRDDAAPWFLILDNADDLGTYFTKDGSNAASREPMASYLPKSGNSKILITSRNLNVAERLTGDHKAILRIPTMQSSEALSILENKLASGYDAEAGADLIRALDFIPLAVNQAAAYINRRSPRVSIESYLEDFRRGEKQKSGLLQSDAGDIRRHESATNSVVLTWQVTFEQIRQERPTAANLLSLMSLFQPQKIPEYLLYGYNRAAVGVKDIERDGHEDFEDDLDVLRAYSLVSIAGRPGLLDMHPLVQFCTQQWLVTFDDLPRWKSLFMMLLWRGFPSPYEYKWDTRQLFVSHMQSVMNERPLDKRDTLTWTNLLRDAAFYMIDRGNYSEAEILARRSLDVQKEVLGNDASETVRSMQTLATALHYLGRFEEAEQLFLPVINVRKTSSKDGLLYMSLAKNGLSLTYEKQGRPEEAANPLEELMEYSKSQPGADDAILHVTRVNLGRAYILQGRWDEGEEMLLQELDRFRRSPELDGLYKLGLPLCNNHLASSYWMQGRRKEAEMMAVEALASFETRVGVDHPFTLDCSRDLAVILHRTGKTSAAIELLEENVRRRRSTQGLGHPQTQHVMARLEEYKQEAAELQHS